MAMFTAQPDLGKTMFAIALGLAMACQPRDGFCEWLPTGKRAKVLYIRAPQTAYFLFSVSMLFIDCFWKGEPGRKSRVTK
jgi:hypothetical protein